MKEAVGADLWDAYWLRLANLKSEMDAAEQDAVAIRQSLAVHFLPKFRINAKLR